MIDVIYRLRKSRITNPNGTFDSKGRWYPDTFELCECCDCIRSPSVRYPYSLMVHCRSKKHITSLLSKHGTGHSVLRAEYSVSLNLAGKYSALNGIEHLKGVCRSCGKEIWNCVSFDPVDMEGLVALRYILEVPGIVELCDSCLWKFTEQIRQRIRDKYSGAETLKQPKRVLKV
jgi:hypothetical protein